jgi:hypothetical protein
MSVTCCVLVKKLFDLGASSCSMMFVLVFLPIETSHDIGAKMIHWDFDRPRERVTSDCFCRLDGIFLGGVY